MTCATCRRDSRWQFGFACGGMRGPRRLLSGTHAHLALRPSATGGNRQPWAFIGNTPLKQRQHMLRTSGRPVRQQAMPLQIQRAATVSRYESPVSHDLAFSFFNNASEIRNARTLFFNNVCCEVPAANFLRTFSHLLASDEIARMAPANSSCVYFFMRTSTTPCLHRNCHTGPQQPRKIPQMRNNRNISGNIGINSKIIQNYYSIMH